MEKYKEDFINFLVERESLTFGEFELKSGRISPYFLSTGFFSDGLSIAKLGYFYASKIIAEKLDFNIVFGPAYKGIPLAVSTAMSLAKDFNKNKGYTFDRKESKEYADKSAFVGEKLKDGAKILMIDDVMTTGKTKEDVIEKIRKEAKVKFVGLVIALDRMEQGKDGEDAIGEFEKKYNIPIYSIVSVAEVKEYLHNKEINGKVCIDDEIKKKMDEYASKYGVTR